MSKSNNIKNYYANKWANQKKKELKDNAHKINIENRSKGGKL